MQRFRDGLVFTAHTLCVSLNSRLESNKEEQEGQQPCGMCTANHGQRETSFCELATCDLARTFVTRGLTGGVILWV